jgi:hypothetical protein
MVNSEKPEAVQKKTTAAQRATLRESCVEHENTMGLR